MNHDLIESKIKIIRANISILERAFDKNKDIKTKTKIEQEKKELEELKNFYPAFFI